MMVLATMIISTSGLLVRLIEAAGDWQIVFWRGLSLAVGIFAILVLQYRGKTFVEVRRLGLLGLLGGVLLAGTLIGYVLAVVHTTIANAVFTMSAVPVLTAVLAWIVLGERVSALTAGAILFSVGGIALMVGDGISTGTVFGNVMALFAASCAACFFVVLRKGRNLNMLPTTAIGALVSALVAAFMLAGAVQISLYDLALCVVLGGVIGSAAHFLIVTSSRHLSGAEITLLTLIEFILSPIWVWVFINEVPSAMTITGGGIVLSAVGMQAVFSLLGQGK